MDELAQQRNDIIRLVAEKSATSRLVEQFERRYRQVTLIVAKAFVPSERFLDIVPIVMARHRSQSRWVELGYLSDRMVVLPELLRPTTIVREPRASDNSACSILRTFSMVSSMRAPCSTDGDSRAASSRMGRKPTSLRTHSS